jgi:hypothetical protein
MINMNSLKRVIPFAGAFLLAGAMVGCGDDEPSNDPIDAGDIDANQPPVVDAGAADACVGGHGEGCVGTPFALPEHGEFRIELFQTGPSGTGADTRLAAQAFFFTDQTPPVRPIGGMPITIRQSLADQGYSCGDLRAGTFFENGRTPEAQAATDSRTYIDVGANATLTSADDPTEVVTLDKFLASADPTNARDISSDLLHDILYRADEDTEIELGTQYKPEVAGSAAYLGLDLGYGEAAFTMPELADANGEGEPLLYMPADFQLTQPTEAEFYAAAGLTFTKGQDFEFKYTIDVPEDVAGDFPTVIPFVGWVKNREVQAYCLKVTPNVLDDGTFLVPYEVLEILDQDPPATEEESYVEFGRLTHAVWEAQNLAQPARIDLLGVNCLLSPDWKINEAAP